VVFFSLNDFTTTVQVFLSFFSLPAARRNTSGLEKTEEFVKVR
jgi:hypothetical protein